MSRVTNVLCYFSVQQKSPFYLFLVGGWSFSVYAIQLIFRNLSVILQDHWHVALGRPLINTNPIRSRTYCKVIILNIITRLSHV